MINYIDDEREIILDDHDEYDDQDYWDDERLDYNWCYDPYAEDDEDE